MDYTRKNHIITNTETKEVEVFKSINAAKRKSRELQKTGNKVTVIREGS